VGCIIEEN